MTQILGGGTHRSQAVAPEPLAPRGDPVGEPQWRDAAVITLHETSLPCCGCVALSNLLEKRWAVLA